MRVLLVTSDLGCASFSNPYVQSFPLPTRFYFDTFSYSSSESAHALYLWENFIILRYCPNNSLITVKVFVKIGPLKKFHGILKRNMYKNVLLAYGENFDQIK